MARVLASGFGLLASVTAMRRQEPEDRRQNGACSGFWLLTAGFCHSYEETGARRQETEWRVFWLLASDCWLLLRVSSGLIPMFCARLPALRGSVQYRRRSLPRCRR